MRAHRTCFITIHSSNRIRFIPFVCNVCLQTYKDPFYSIGRSGAYRYIIVVRNSRSNGIAFELNLAKQTIKQHLMMVI